MNDIKRRRLESLRLTSYPDLLVGSCVPFYFCPRSVMLYVIHRGNHPGVTYQGGQGPIVHLEADLRRAVEWASHQHRRWAITLTNAGSSYFEDRCDLSSLNEIDWKAVHAQDWRSCKETKQAEFLLEHSFPWSLVERIGVLSSIAQQQVVDALGESSYQPPTEVLPEWYY